MTAAFRKGFNEAPAIPPGKTSVVLLRNRRLDMLQ